MKTSKFFGLVVGLLIVMSVILHYKQQKPLLITLPAVFVTGVCAVGIGHWHKRNGRLH